MVMIDSIIVAITLFTRSLQLEIWHLFFFFFLETLQLSVVLISKPKHLPE